MLHIKSVMRIMGQIFIAIGAAFLVPAMVSLFYKEHHMLAPFLLPQALALGFGISTQLSAGREKTVINSKDGMLAVALSWLFISILGALPYMVSGIIRNPVSAFFESVSSFTTTGATVFEDVELLPRSMIVWRSFSQWLGGMGILVLLTSLTQTFSGESASSVFNAESPGIRSDNVAFGSKNTSRVLYTLYTGFLLLQIGLLRLCGFSWFDAAIFSFGTSASGGLNNYRDGLMHITTPAAELVLAVFMILSCISYVLFIFASKKDWESIKKSTEFKAYGALLAGSSALVTLNLYFSGTYKSLLTAFRYGGFQAVSFMTTTGLASTDFSAWPPFSRFLLTMLTFVGGCSVSTGGALKVIRVVILFKLAARAFTTRLHPRAVITLKVNEKPLPSYAANGVIYYFLTYIGLFIAGAFFLTFDPAADLQTAFTASAAMLSNVGTGFGSMGIFADYCHFGIFSRFVMSFLMLAGRLEIYTVLLPLSRRFWQEKI